MQLLEYFVRRTCTELRSAPRVTLKQRATKVRSYVIKWAQKIMNEKNLLKIDLKTVSLRNEALEQFMLEVMSFIKERSKKIKNQHISRRQNQEACLRGAVEVDRNV